MITSWTNVSVKLQYKINICTRGTPHLSWGRWTWKKFSLMLQEFLQFWKIAATLGFVGHAFIHFFGEGSSFKVASLPPISFHHCPLEKEGIQNSKYEIFLLIESG